MFVSYLLESVLKLNGYGCTYLILGRFGVLVGLQHAELGPRFELSTKFDQVQQMSLRV
jgi:hypothetical protein